MSTQLQPGIQFARDARGHHSTVATGKSIFHAALALADAPAALALLDEKDWRRRYPQHLVQLNHAAARDGVLAVAMARAALQQAQLSFDFVRDGRTFALTDAMHSGAAMVGSGFQTIEITGRGAAAPKPWSLPYHGRELQGGQARDVIAQWQAQGICEPGHAQALYRVLDHPEWFDLSDRTVVLLGAGSEAGPLVWLAQWRARIVAVDLPRPAVWQRIANVIGQGNATLVAPVREGWPAATEHAGADLLTDTPEIAAWLCGLPDAALDIGCIAYLDGEKHVRAVMGMDAVASAVVAAKPGSTRMTMATPTDAFTVPEPIARAAMDRFEQRGLLQQAADKPLWALTGARWLKPHVKELIDCVQPAGQRMGVVDALVVQQGPNYALAKRLQQWRATVARDQGQRVVFNVAPSTTTQSVIKNPALKAGFDGAHRFGIEVFEPATTNALMAALWVHDLRTAAPRFAHPLEALTHQANHGGLWRVGYLPRSALPLAALMGLMKL
jgi:hypothetical protein